MINILIVDDEFIIREGLAHGVDWSQCNATILPPAENGDKALLTANKTMPDILITDISMPGMNGIELIMKMTELNPNLKSIILTGYDSFEYAKQAISLNICEYLLKPIDPDELINVVNKLIDKINEEEELQSKYKMYESLALAFTGGNSNQDYGHKDNNLDKLFDDDTSKNKNLINSVKTYIINNCSSNINLTEISNNFHISYSYLSLLFKKETGTNINEFITTTRIARAKQLLTNPDYKIYEVGCMVGIPDSHYFSRIFKKITGLNPKQYREALGIINNE